MFGLGKKVTLKEIEINEGYNKYLKDKDGIQIICVDEVKDYDKEHIADAECFPFRLLSTFEDYYPDRDVKYYIYALNASLSEKACKKLMKQGYDVYHLGAYMNYLGELEGMDIPRKRRKK